MRLVKLSTDGTYLLLMACIYAVSPILSLMIALILYKRTISQFFFVAFAFYFGYQLGVNMDLIMHWENFLEIRHMSFANMYKDLDTLHIGHEPYHIVLKYILAKFDVSMRVFSGTVCALYTLYVVIFLRQFQTKYKSKDMNATTTLVLLIVITTVEFFWYHGIRFWAGCFIFLIFYSRYIITDKKIYLFLSPICMLFHIVLIIAILAAFFVEVTRNNRIIQYTLLAFSFIYKHVDYGITQFLASFDFVKIYYKTTLQNQQIQRRIAAQNKEIIEHGNIVYNNRIPIMLFIFFALLFWLWTKNKAVTRSYPKLFGLVLISFSIVNFGFANYLLYERFLKLTCLMAYAYLFLVLFDKRNLWMTKNLFVKIICGFVVLFCLAVAFMQGRKFFMEMPLWFGNFFTTIDIQYSYT